MTKLLGYSMITMLGLAFVAVASQPNPADQPIEAGTEESDSTSDTSVDDATLGSSPTVSSSESDFPAAQAAPVTSSSKQDILARLLKALETFAAVQRNPQTSDQSLQQARDELKKTLVEVGRETQKEPNCEDDEPKDCQPVCGCVERDATIVVHLPPSDYRRPTYTAEGARGFVSIFSAAAARGVENATIRAINAAKVCPTCNSTEHKPDGPEKQPD